MPLACATGTAAHSGIVSCMSDGATPGKKPPAPSMTTRPGTLILRKTRAQAVISGWNPDIWGEDDYCIVDADRVVGRIYPQTSHGEPRWLWFLQTEPAPPPNSGMATSLEEAKAAFKRRYSEVKGTPPESDPGPV
jgi:hypothetical protein